MHPQLWCKPFFIRCRSCWERLHDSDGAVSLHEETGAGASAENRERERRRWASTSRYRTRSSQGGPRIVRTFLKLNNPAETRDSEAESQNEPRIIIVWTFWFKWGTTQNEWNRFVQNKHVTFSLFNQRGTKKQLFKTQNVDSQRTQKFAGFPLPEVWTEVGVSFSTYVFVCVCVASVITTVGSKVLEMWGRFAR